MSRFLHYDCVVAPESSITSQKGFPWEKVTLLIEYEPLKQPLFDEEVHSDAQSGMETNDCDDKRPSLGQLKLREYVTLKTTINKPTGIIIYNIMKCIRFECFRFSNALHN